MSNKELADALEYWARAKHASSELIHDLRAAASALRASEWRTDMENAPKHDVLLFYSERRTVHGQLRNPACIRLGQPRDWPLRPATAWKAVDLTPPPQEGEK